MRRQTSYWQIAHSQKFVSLVARRRRITKLLSWIVLGLFAVFTSTMIFLPQFVATPLVPGSTIPKGVLFSLFFIVSAVGLSGYYTWCANKNFDGLQREVVTEFKSQQHED